MIPDENTKYGSGPSGVHQRDKVLVAVSLVAIVFFIAQVLTFRYGRDQGIFVMVADAILHGRMPYRDAWDFKPPGIFLFFTLARLVFGSNPIGIRAVEVVGLGVSAYWMVKLAHHWWNDVRIGYVAAALTMMVHAQLDFWHTAQPESFGGMLTIGALWLWARAERRSLRERYLAIFVGGAMFGFAGLLKPPLIAGSAVFSLALSYDAWSVHRSDPPFQIARRAMKPVILVWVGTVVPLVVCAAWFFVRGALSDLWEVLFLFTPHYTALGWRGQPPMDMVYKAVLDAFVGYSSSFAVGIVLLLAVPSSRAYRGLFMVLGLIGFHVLGIALQAKFFPYHYGATFPLVALLAAIGYVKLWDSIPTRKPLVMAAYFGAFCAITSISSATVDTRTTFFARTAKRMEWIFNGFRDTENADRLSSVVDVNALANRAVAQYVREHTPATCSMFVWGFEPVIYDLAQRQPASRYIYNLGQRIPRTRDALRAVMMQELEHNEPCALLVEHTDVFPLVSGTKVDSAAELANFTELSRFLSEHYALDRTIEDFDVYLRR
ncbi:hypothetical protein LVJ94_51545 [Pendulispora rubella]|uniref:Glycosyltransferase RgtA/B/C/D-like domain-containing protein n=1 Tax=Pendulispora rubella TaxID=2741070 RepID=A0ABZ2L802_9BACT